MAHLTKPVVEVLAELRARRDLLSANEVEDRKRPTRIATDIPELDLLLGGGFPMGALVELAGGPLGAGTAVALRLAERLTARGHLVGWCDGANALDAETAARAGVDLDRLCWARPPALPEALRAAYAFLNSGGFPLVVLDLGLLGEVGRVPGSPVWLRLARCAEIARGSLLVLAPVRVSPGSFSSATLTISRVRPRFTGRGAHRLFAGAEVVLTLMRNKLGVSSGTARLVLEAPLLEPVERFR